MAMYAYERELCFANGILHIYGNHQDILLQPAADHGER